MDHELSGGRFARPVRRDDTVLRRAGSANQRALLQYFEQLGFELAPRWLGTTDGGTRDVLSYLPGTSGYPPLTDVLRSDEALVNVARAIRAFHDAAAGFVPVDDEWADHEVAVPAAIDCLGHHDLAPWNFVFEGAEVVGILDWDSIRPSNRGWDLAYAAHQFVPFHPTEDLPAWGWPVEPDRAARLRLFCAAYGTGVTPAELVDLIAIRLLGFAAHMEQEIRHGNPAFAVQAEEGHAAAYRGAAAWVLRHRSALLDG